MSTLYIVATPIGNLEDITLRAIHILKYVSVIFCEDTRTTRVLLDKYEIKTRTESLNARTEKNKLERVFGVLRDGGDVAYVSDAGTPGISDPGALLVSSVRKSLPEVSIVPIPGVSALTSLLSVSGYGAREIIFFGFLPHKKGRMTAFKEIVGSDRACIFYESPHRIEKALESLSVSDKKIIIGRELTKKFEEIISGTAVELLKSLKDRDVVCGEFVVMVLPLHETAVDEV